MGAEYFNYYVMSDGKAYRVALHRSGRVMIVCRKTKHDETALSLDGPTARKVSAQAVKEHHLNMRLQP